MFRSVVDWKIDFAVTTIATVVVPVVAGVAEVSTIGRNRYSTF